MVARQAELATELGAERIRAVATAAIRNASNARELVAAVERRAGIPLEVLTGEAEAGLAFRGAAYAVEAEGTLVVIDVGGGSTEIAVGSAGGGVERADRSRSAHRCWRNAHLRADPPSESERAALRDEVSRALEEFEPPAVDQAVAVGGSATSLLHLAGRELGPAELDRALETLCSGARRGAGRALSGSTPYACGCSPPVCSCWRSWHVGSIGHYGSEGAACARASFSRWAENAERLRAGSAGAVSAFTRRDLAVAILHRARRRRCEKAEKRYRRRLGVEPVAEAEVGVDVAPVAARPPRASAAASRRRRPPSARSAGTAAARPPRRARCGTRPGPLRRASATSSDSSLHRQERPAGRRHGRETRRAG